MFNENKINMIKEKYPKGTKIKLISMNDSQAVPSGTIGIVDFVDDAGTIQMNWENGSSLGLIDGEDQFEIISKKYNDIMKNIDCNEVLDLKNKNYEYLVIQGCGGNLDEWVDGITNLFKENEIVSDDYFFQEIYTFDNNGLTNLLFGLDDTNIDIGKLSIFRLKLRETFGAMWLSDYIDNGYIKDISMGGF